MLRLLFRQTFRIRLNNGRRLSKEYGSFAKSKKHKDQRNVLEQNKDVVAEHLVGLPCSSMCTIIGTFWFQSSSLANEFRYKLVSPKTCEHFLQWKDSGVKGDCMQGISRLINFVSAIGGELSFS